MSLWNVFSTKDKKINKLKDQFDKGIITKEKLYSEVHNIDPESVNKVLTPKDQEIFSITGKFNRNEIDLIQYKEQIKNLDFERWFELATEDEKFLDQLEKDLKDRKITEAEYNKELATFNKQVYINIENIEFDADGEGKHSISLDWNSYFIEELKSIGYTGQTDEELVDKWFVAFCTTIAAESESIIVMDTDDMRKVKYDKTGNKTEHF